jgi:hypothetical protein
MLHSTPGGRRSTTPEGKKKFGGMTLAAVRVAISSCRAFLPAFSIVVALSPPPLLAVRGSAISPPRLPLPPPACLLAARLAAVACQRPFGPEDAPAALQETDPPPGTTSPTLAPGDLGRGLIFGRSWAIFTTGHGRCCSQKLKPRRGHTFPFGAPSAHREGSNLATLPQNSDRIKRRAPVRTELPHCQTNGRVHGVGQIWRAYPGSFLASA